MENMELLQAMRQMLSENNRQMMEEMNRQMAENNRQMMEEMHTQIQDAVAPIYSRLDKVESELQSVKALATKTQLIVENEIDRKINLLLEAHINLCNRVAQLEMMNEILEEMEDDLWNLKQIAARQILFGKSSSSRRKPNM